MGTLPMNIEQGLKFIAEELRTQLQPDVEEDAKLIQKGMLLYRQGLVSSLRFENDQIFATVQDVTPVKVRLDLTFFDTSDCNCPSKGVCRHKIALFFTAYSKMASVGDWIDLWREPMKAKQAATKWGIQRAKDLLKANGVLQPDYDRWIEAFEESFKNIINPEKIPNPYVLNDLFHVYRRRIRASAPLEAEWKLLYELIAAIYSFQKVVEISGEQIDSHPQAERYISPLLEELTEDVEQFVHKLGIQTMPFAFDAFLSRLRADTSKLLEPLPFPYVRIELFRVLWGSLFKRKEWREEELARINGRSSVEVRIAEMHLHFLLQQDEEAIQILQELGPMSVLFLLPSVETMNQRREWSRLKPYIELFVDFSKEYIKNYRSAQQSQQFARVVIKTILPYCQETKSDDLYERTLQHLLPYSYAHYDTFLFDHGDYERWGELQAYIGIDLDWVGKDRINILATENPETLISLYHQAIQIQIETKNRQSYRLAVRQLKKLRTLYKKQKRVPEWEEYIELLIEKTKRLRAFHEECIRGKLIHA